MPRSRLLFLPVLLAAGLATLPACGKDSSPTGPSVTFPTLPSALLTAFCVQGQKLPGQAIAGTLATTDCPLGDGTYYEVWHVRVGTAGTYTFTAASTFDNLLAVLRLDSYTSSSANLTSIGSDDDSGTGTNAMLSVPLAIGTDYFVVVNGFSASDVGPYAVTFAGP